MQALLSILSQEQGNAEEPSLEYLRAMDNHQVKMELSRFKGLGPKTISCVLLFGMGRGEVRLDEGRRTEGCSTLCLTSFSLTSLRSSPPNSQFPVDTHVLRIAKNNGWVSPSETREGAYKVLNSLVPDDIKMDLHCLLVKHGKVCHKCAANGRPQFPPASGPLVCPLVKFTGKKVWVKVRAGAGGAKRRQIHLSLPPPLPAE